MVKFGTQDADREQSHFAQLSRGVMAAPMSVAVPGITQFAETLLQGFLPCRGCDAALSVLSVLPYAPPPLNLTSSSGIGTRFP